MIELTKIIERINILHLSGQTELFQQERGAIFSPDRQYRYFLWRRWNVNAPHIMFIGLNPSTANETKNDATITRVKGFAKDWGYGGVYMCNLFGLISTSPKALIGHPDPVGDNDYWLNLLRQHSAMVVFAWGGFFVNGRDKKVIEMFPDAFCLIKNADGSPHHPLRLSKKIKPIKFL